MNIDLAYGSMVVVALLWILFLSTKEGKRTWTEAPVLSVVVILVSIASIGVTMSVVRDWRSALVGLFVPAGILLGRFLVGKTRRPN